MNQEEWDKLSLEERIERAPRYLNIEPRSFDLEQRVEAVRQATEMGRGVHMDIGNVTTRFYAVLDVPVGHVKVTAPKTYKGWPEDVTTLTSPEETFGRAELDAWINS